MENYILLVVLFICTTIQAQIPDTIDSTFSTHVISVIEPTITKNNNYLNK